jgi:hypothetical protein
MGNLNGEATIAAHNNALSGWAKLVLNPSGVTNVGNLSGTGNRMVIAAANGDLSTQAIPTGGDNLGSHTASQALNLNGNWLSNDGTNKGIKIDNSGNVGVNMNAPVGSLDVANINSVYTGNFTTVSSGSFAFQSTFFPQYPLAHAFDGNTSTFWKGRNFAPEFIGQDFGAGNEKIIRLVTFVYPNLAPGPQSFWETRYSAEVLASNDGVSYTSLASTSSSLCNNCGSNKVVSIPLSNTVSYRYYQLKITQCSVYSIYNGTLPIEPTILEAYFATEATGLIYTSGALTVKDNNTGIGIVPTGTNKLEVNGTGGAKISSTNTGATSGAAATSDWIATNVGGTAGDRVVSGILNGKATIGAHNNALNAWSDLQVGGGGTVVVGTQTTASPAQAYNATNGIASRNLVVNGSIRQACYIQPITVPANNVTYITWTHNFGYGPIVMMSTDQNGGGEYMDFCTYTTFNNNNNQTVFIIRNTGSNAASGNFRWIVVN